jgi:hypothetical protein
MTIILAAIIYTFFDFGLIFKEKSRDAFKGIRVNMLTVLAIFEMSSIEHACISEGRVLSSIRLCSPYDRDSGLPVQGNFDRGMLSHRFPCPVQD